jgi:hypothetical protein
MVDQYFIERFKARWKFRVSTTISQIQLRRHGIETIGNESTKVKKDVIVDQYFIDRFKAR